MHFSGKCVAITGRQFAVEDHLSVFLLSVAVWAVQEVANDVVLPVSDPVMSTERSTAHDRSIHP